MLKKLSVFLLGGLIAINVQASEFGIDLSDNTLNFTANTDVSEQVQGSLQWLHHDDHGDFFAVGMHAKGILPVNDQYDRFKALLGVKAFALDTDKPRDGEGSGLALGGRLIVDIVPMLSVETGLHYSPAVTSFADVDHVIDGNLQLNVQPFPGAAIVAGYRHLEVDLQHRGDTEIHKGLYIGLRIMF